MSNFKDIELFKILDSNKLYMHNIKFKNYKKYALVFGPSSQLLDNQTNTWKKQCLYLMHNNDDYFYIRYSNKFNSLKIIHKFKIIGENNFLSSSINFLKNSDFLKKEISNKLLHNIINNFFLINYKKNITLLDIMFFKLTLNHKNNVAKLSIISKNNELCIALKSSLQSLKNIFDTYDIQLKKIIIENYDFCKNNNYNNPDINEIYFFKKILRKNKEFQKYTIDNKFYLQNTSIISSLIDIYV